MKLFTDDDCGGTAKQPNAEPTGAPQTARPLRRVVGRQAQASARTESDVKLDVVLTGNLDHFRDVWRTRRNLAIQRGEHRNCLASPTRDFQHFAATGAIAKRMNGISRDMYKRTRRAHGGLATRCE